MSQPVGIRPGMFRWAVKTLQDAAASRIGFSKPVGLDLSTAASWPNPGVTQQSTNLPRIAGSQEFLVYRFLGKAVWFKLEADGDYHLLIDDGKGRRLNVEFPDPAFVGVSIKATALAQARADFEKLIGKSSTPSVNYTPVNAKVTVIGVGFWDEAHGQGGIGNGFELHPILSIQQS